MGGSGFVDGVAFPEFDNFYVAPIVTADGLTWQTAEHLYQASKFKDATWRLEINQCRASHHYYRMGQSREHVLIDDFENKKANLMYYANWAKFTQNLDLRAKLLQTQGSIVFRGSTAFWNATNGRILEVIRERLRYTN